MNSLLWSLTPRMEGSLHSLPLCLKQKKNHRSKSNTLKLMYWKTKQSQLEWILGTCAVKTQWDWILVPLTGVPADPRGILFCHISHLLYSIIPNLYHFINQIVPNESLPLFSVPVIVFLCFLIPMYLVPVYTNINTNVFAFDWDSQENPSQKHPILKF